MNLLKPSVGLAALFFLSTAASLRANVKLPAIFGDHMVLQQGRKLPVWGTADPGEAVMVTVGKETAQTKADANGKWRIDLPALDTGAAAVTMKVVGKNTLTFNDVLVGEVWLCSGQSNMGFSLSQADHSAEAVAQANDPQMRFFRVAKKDSIDPQSDVGGKWEICTPNTSSVFSAVGFFLGCELRHDLQRPVGLIEAAHGSTPAQAWTSLSGLKKEPLLKPYVETYEQNRAHFDQATAEYPASLAAYQEKIAQWQKSDEGKAATEKLKAWQKAASEAKAAGKTPPVRPHPPTSTPQEPLPPDGGPYAPTTLYNAMIAPLIPFAIKGVAWYQGEANHAEGKAYRTLFGNMISDWREKWGEGDFPFVFVQLAALDKGKGSIQSLPCVRESQLKTLSLPNTGMAVTVDIGNPHNIHPTDKVDVGHRLALAARYVAYDEKLVYSGPIYDAMKISGNKITVTFTQTGSGLIVGSAPWVPPGQDPLPTDKLMGFEIAGADHKWVPADARIEEDAIVVSSPQVPAPVAVRYDWANAPKGNFYNKEKLPASPFRTDDWPDPIAEGHITSSGDSSPAVKE